MIKKAVILVCLFQFLFLIAQAQSTIKNYVYTHRDTVSLSMDIYTPAQIKDKYTTIIFIFGGGFVSGSKSEEDNVAYCKKLANEGFAVASIDYRLGMIGVKKAGPYALKRLRDAINMGVEDLYDATKYLIAHADELKIDTGKIILNGSSAGAIIALHADHELANRTAIASVLPGNFRYAGVISFAGAILSFDGKPKYKTPPVPTLFFHGMDDKLVRYKQIQIFNVGFFGSNTLVKRFNKSDYPYCIFRYRNMGHEIAVLPMIRHVHDVASFINEYIILKRPLEIDVTIEDRDLKRIYFATPKDLGK